MSRVASSLRVTNPKGLPSAVAASQETPNSSPDSAELCQRRLQPRFRLQVSEKKEQIYSREHPSALAPKFSKSPKLLAVEARMQTSNRPASLTLKVRPILFKVFPHSGAINESFNLGETGSEPKPQGEASLDEIPLNSIPEKPAILLTQTAANKSRSAKTKKSLPKSPDATTHQLVRTSKIDQRLGMFSKKQIALELENRRIKSILKKTRPGSTSTSSKHPTEVSGVIGNARTGSVMPAGQSPEKVESPRKRVTFSKFRAVAIYIRQQSSEAEQQ